MLAFGIVLLGYGVSLAPSCTFWDAGEFIAASHILGIPHPPGTPLFVLLGRVWDALIPAFSTAVKTNLMSATFSAGSAAFLFLFVHQALARGAAGLDSATAKLFRVGGAFAAALIGAFTFTNWQNSNETEVYQVAMFSIGLVAWLCWLWRRDRGGARGTRRLLLLVYVLAIALGNHLMALLVGPAVIAFMYHVLRTEPAPPAEQAAQWAAWGVAGSLWLTMVGVGIASTVVIVAGLALFAAAAVYAFRAGNGSFAMMALAVCATGLSSYAFLYIRAGLHPIINEADPATLRNLWAVIGRQQFPVRTPLDNPIYPHGPGNPGRFVLPFDLHDPSAGGKPSLLLLGLQIANFLQYQDWQFAASLQKDAPLFAVARLPFTLGFLALAVWGAVRHRRWDRASWWFLFTLWATTSAGLIGYLNFKPGASLGYAWFPDHAMHEVRERDYFYTVAFVAAGLWAGMGLATAFARLRRWVASPRRAAPVLLVALLPFILNFGAAGRRHIPSSTLPADFAYDLLNSVEPYGILFTNGDNDTFPLWYAQEVEGIRQDVAVVNLSLANTDWYIRQLRDDPARRYRPDSTAAALYGPSAGPPPACSAAWADTLDAWARAAGRRPPDRSRGMPSCLLTLSDARIGSLEARVLPDSLTFRAGPITHTYPRGTALYVKDIVVLRLIEENLGKRPIFFSLTTGAPARMGLDPFFTERALVYKLYADSVRADANRVAGVFGPHQPPVDLAWTRRLAHGAYRYARLFAVKRLDLDPVDQDMATNLALPIWSLGFAALQRNDAGAALVELDQVAHLMPDNQAVQNQIQQIRAVVAAARMTPDSLSAGPRDTVTAPHGGAGRR